MVFLFGAVISVLSYLIVGMGYAHWSSPTIWRSVCKDWPRNDGYSEDFIDKKRAENLLMMQRMSVFLWPLGLARDAFYTASHHAFPTPEELDEDLKAKRRAELEKELGIDDD